MDSYRRSNPQAALTALEAAAASARGGFACMFSSSDEYETALITERRAQGLYDYQKRYWPTLMFVGCALMLAGGLANTSFVGLPMIEAFFGAPSMATGILIDQLGTYLVLSTLGITSVARDLDPAVDNAASGGGNVRPMGRLGWSNQGWRARLVQ